MISNFKHLIFEHHNYLLISVIIALRLKYFWTVNDVSFCMLCKAEGSLNFQLWNSKLPNALIQKYSTYSFVGSDDKYMYLSRFSLTRLVTLISLFKKSKQKRAPREKPSSSKLWKKVTLQKSFPHYQHYLATRMYNKKWS